LAFQCCECDEQGEPTPLAFTGALLHAEQQDLIRAFSKAYLKTR
jgi:hypothetical protein